MTAPARADLAELRTDVRSFLAAELAAGGFVPRCDNWLAGWDEAFSGRLAERGWVGLTIPVEYGGRGRGAVERFVVTEELLAAGAPVAAHWIADRQIAPSLLRYGTEEQRRRYLPEIAAGRCFFGIGMSEPDSGSDLASVRTRAMRVDGGWRLEGTKVWTSGAHRAHAFFVLARSAPLDAAHRHDGLSQFLVPLDSPGVEVRPIRLLTGEAHFNQVILDGVFVPDAMVLGEVGAGWAQVTSELAFERSGPERFLSTFPLLALLTTVVGREVEDGRALGGLLARLWSLRQMSMRVAGVLAAGGDADLPAAVVKELGTRFEGEVVEVATRLLDLEPDPGANGELARMLAQATLHAPGFTIRGGTNEILRGVIARGVGLR
ncbi:MAG TPA: acyl-CoA dehydrogenase family protein [Mycobacteriales bacterium]